MNNAKRTTLILELIDIQTSFGWKDLLNDDIEEAYDTIQKAIDILQKKIEAETIDIG